MLAVGALVPLSQGRLGKSWKHASALKELARYTLHHSCSLLSDSIGRIDILSRTRPRLSHCKTSGRRINPKMAMNRQIPNRTRPRRLSTESTENRISPMAKPVHAIAPYRRLLRLHLPGSRCLRIILHFRSRPFSILLARSFFLCTRPRYCENEFFWSGRHR